MSYCSEGANCPAISDSKESQLNVPFRIGFSLYYSIYAEDDTDPTHNETLHDQLQEYGRGNMHHHKKLESEGVAVTQGMDEMIYRYVECNKCYFNLDTFKVDDYDTMKKKLDCGLNEIYQLCLDYTDNVHTFELNINLGGYDLISDLVGVTNYILSGKKPKRAIDDNQLLSHAKRKFKDKFEQLKTKGWTIIVRYSSISQAIEVFGDGERAIQKQRQKAEREQIAFLALVTQPGAAGAGPNKAMREAMGKTDVGSTSTAFHMLLGLGSLCWFWPPFAFTCLAIDLSTRVAECAIAFADGDRQAAVENCKGAMLDVFFIIPYERIGRFANVNAHAGAMKLDMKLAERGLQTAEKGQAKSAELLGKAGYNEERLASFKGSIESQKAHIARQREKVSQLENTEKLADYEKAKADLRKAENDLSEMETQYAAALAQSQKENPALLAKAEKYKAGKYNVEDAQAKYDVAKANYTSFVENGVAAGTKNLTKLGTLLQDIREKWNADEFYGVRQTMKAFHNADGTAVTLTGLNDGAVQLRRQGDRIVGESEDFTFCEVLEEAARSIGQDIKKGVVSLGNSFETNRGFNKVPF